jgi:hypothetical protein
MAPSALCTLKPMLFGLLTIATFLPLKYALVDASAVHDGLAKDTSPGLHVPLSVLPNQWMDMA